MKVDIYSDVVCPWCAIGKRRFEVALSQFSHADEVELRWRSFELDPSAPAESEIDVAAHLAEKYGMSKDQAIASQQHLATTAKQDGLDFHFELARRGNTFDAHRLLHYAYEVGVQDALKERLFRAYFSEGEPIGNRQVLVRLAQEVGLDSEKSTEVLESGRYADDVRSDESSARSLGITGVPFFVIEDHYGLSGAQPAEAILQVLEQAWSEGQPLEMKGKEPAGTCQNGSCAI